MREASGSASFLRSELLAILERPSLPSPPPTKVVSPPTSQGEVVAEKVLVQTEEDEWAPLMLVKSTKAGTTAPLPVLIFLHGTGNSNHFLWELGLFHRFALQGFLVVGMDCRYHGERLPDHEKGSSGPYHAALTDSYKCKGRQGGKPFHPFIYDNVWDLIKVVDYLSTRPDVDMSRVASSGISLGGMHTWFLMIADPRITVGAPLIGVQGFQWALDHDSWGPRVDTIRPVFDHAASTSSSGVVDKEVVTAVWDTINPGLLKTFDSPLSLPALAPRPVLICNGGDDPRCPAEGVLAAVEKARTRYRELGVPESLEVCLALGVGHEVTQDMLQRVDAFLARHVLGRPQPPPGDSSSSKM